MMTGKIASLCLFVFLSLNLKAQISIHATPVNISSGTIVSVAGNLQSDQNINGEGKLMLSGNTQQSLDMSSHSISNLDISNASNVLLNSELTISGNLNFSSGKLIIGDHNLYLSDSAGISDSGTTAFISTDGNGTIVKSVSHNLNDFLIPTGNNNTYRPLLLNSTGSYNNATITVQSIDSANSSRPLHIIDRLNNYWTISHTGINGNLNATAQYDGANDVTGDPTHLQGYFFDGNEWSSAGSTSDNAQHLLSIPVTSTTGVIYGMNRFVYAGTRAFLQGAYDSATGMMNDKLRTPVAYLPLSDPYSTTEYSSTFQHVNHSISETINQNILSNQTNDNDNITDWVFLELRNQNLTGNTILSTRSALIQRDGDIVDTDGKSPVTFNYAAEGNYSLSVRHRNHLAMSVNPANGAFLAESKLAAASSNLIDFTTMPTIQIFGNSDGYTTASHPLFGNVKLLWGGNSNGNDNVRYSGYMNDRAAILTSLNNNGNNTNSGYIKNDLNMDGIVDYGNSNSDKTFLLQQVLHDNTLKIITQQLPQ